MVAKNKRIFGKLNENSVQLELTPPLHNLLFITMSSSFNSTKRHYLFLIMSFLFNLNNMIHYKPIISFIAFVIS